MWTWGHNATGQVGDGTFVDRASPQSLGDDFFAVAAAGNFTCRIDDSRTLECWGDNTQGQLGDGTTTDRATPVVVPGASDWQSIAAGGQDFLLNTSTACGIRTNGTLWCWGDNQFGQLGLGDTTDRTSPTQIGTATDWTSVTVGGATVCGIRGSRGFLWCWGVTVPGSSSSHSTPIQIGTADGYTQVDLGYEHGCLLRDPGELYCWGGNTDGQIGDGTYSDRRNPTRIGTDRDWKNLGMGTAHGCATRDDGTLWCWGSNTTGQLGDGTTTERTTPTQVGSATDWLTVDAGGVRFPPPLEVDLGHTCGVRSGGSLWCWGDNQYGQVGDGTTTDRLAPVEIDPATNWTIVALGDRHTAALEYVP